MGILKAHLKLFSILKNEFDDIFEGDLLTISQQAVYATRKEVLDIFIKNKLKLSELPKNFDCRNKIVDWNDTSYEKYTNANTVFKYLGSETIRCCDVSNYENPDFIINLNTLVEKNLFNKFDNIIDIGTLEHVFDIKQALSNYVKLLKINGYLLISVPCSNMINHGFYSFSPTLFYDFFSINGFEIKKSFLRESSPFVYEKKSTIYEYVEKNEKKSNLFNFFELQTVNEIPFISPQSTEFTFVAQKINSYSEIKIPTQSIYDKSIQWNKGKGMQDTFLLKISNKRKLIKLIKKLLKQMISFLPFYFHKKIFLIIRGKKIKKIKGKY